MRHGCAWPWRWRRHHAFAQRLVARAIPGARRRVAAASAATRRIRPGRSGAASRAGLPLGVTGSASIRPTKLSGPRRAVDEVPRLRGSAGSAAAALWLLPRAQAVGVRRQAAAAGRFARGRIGARAAPSSRVSRRADSHCSGRRDAPSKGERRRCPPRAARKTGVKSSHSGLPHVGRAPRRREQRAAHV